MSHASGTSEHARAIPSGIVVFLFSDIEGSTIRWEADQRAMQSALRRHDALFADAIARGGGYVFKTIGDAFCAAFHDAPSAVASALDIQRLLVAEDWSDVNGLRVRMALHAGNADERDGDYFGTTVNRVARLLSTAYAGQVILSNVTAKLARDALPPEASLRDLGSHVLKDLRDPERVFQLCVPDLPSDFRPLRSLDTRLDNLPAQLTSFIGREAELEDLDERLRGGRLVTVVGPGGVGKTRTALRAAERFVSAAGEACFVELGPLADAALVVGTILAATGIADSGTSPLESLVEALRTRRILLVLDTCEHVVVEVARVVRAIVERCPNVVILGTSREPLGVIGERSIRLAPFDRKTAIALFADRATTANRKFVLDDTTRATVAAVCDRLDGIALAIELAAARLRAFSLGELARLLDERFRILTGGSRTALPHQQTVRALIDWSYDLLAEDERALFRRLAVFRGRFTLAAAAKVCADDNDDFAVLDRLAALVDKSLVVADLEDDPAYRFLQLIEAYARERLGVTSEANDIAARHAAFFTDLAEETYLAWEFAPPVDWLRRAVSDIDNIRAALAWSLERGADEALGARLTAAALPVFLRLSLLDEGLAWCDAALRVPADAMSVAVEARLHYMASMLHNNQVAFARTLVSATQALACYERAGDERGIARALSQVARQYARNDRRDEAVELATRAVALARNVNDGRLLAATLQRGAAVFAPADIERARVWFAESVTLFRRLGRDDETARALEWWSVAEADAGCVDRALEVAREGLPLAGHDARPYITSSIAAFALALGDDDLATATARDAFALAADVRHPVLLPLALTYLAAVSAGDDPAAAARALGYAYARLGEHDWKLDEIDITVADRVRAELGRHMQDDEIETARSEGASWDEARAILAGYEM